MAMNVGFTNPRPQMVQEQPQGAPVGQGMDTMYGMFGGNPGLAQAPAVMTPQFTGQQGSVGPDVSGVAGGLAGGMGQSGLASPLAQALAAQQSASRGYTDPSPYGQPQMSTPSYNAANPWGGGGGLNWTQGMGANPGAGFGGVASVLAGGMAGNSGMAPRGYQTKPMQSPILGPMNQPAPYMPPNFRRRMFQHGTGGGGAGVSGAGGFGINPMGQNGQDRGILPNTTFV